jgi:hypothetical protein
MSTIRQISLAAAFTLASFATTPSAHAAPGSVSSARITNVRVYNSDGNPSVVVQFDQSRSGTIACSPFVSAMAIDGSTAKGKLIASNAMAAFLAGKKVTVIGTGLCLSGTPFEAISDFSILQ